MGAPALAAPLRFLAPPLPGAYRTAIGGAHAAAAAPIACVFAIVGGLSGEVAILLAALAFYGLASAIAAVVGVAIAWLLGRFARRDSRGRMRAQGTLLGAALAILALGPVAPGAGQEELVLYALIGGLATLAGLGAGDALSGLGRGDAPERPRAG
jgi:hypothetical protein